MEQVISENKPPIRLFLQSNGEGIEVTENPKLCFIAYPKGFPNEDGYVNLYITVDDFIEFMRERQ